MITRLKVEGFRSLAKLDVTLSQICAVVGPNNSGKSNLLLALYRVLARDWVTVSSFSESDVYGRDPTGDVRIEVSIEPPLQYAKLKGVAPSPVSTLAFEFTRYKVGDRKGERRLEQKALDSKGRPVAVLAKKPKLGEPHKYEPLVNIPQALREQLPLIYIGGRRSVRDQLPSARYSLLRPLLEDIERDFHDPQRKVVVSGQDGEPVEVPRSERFAELLQAAVEMLRTSEFVKLEESIKRNALDLLGFRLEEDSEKLDFYFAPFGAMDFYRSLIPRVREGDFSIDATEMGEGIQNALVLAILRAFEERRKKGAVILIEEPEMYLHPQMQRSLFRTIRRLGETNQVIYTTHSPHFVGIPHYEEVLLLRKGEDGSTARRSDLEANDKRREKLIKEFDPTRNELFFASRLLLVEGDTERLALPEYASRLKLDLDRVGATIVEVGGKRNFAEFINIATSFGIPTGVLFDKDSSDFQDEEEEEKFNAALSARETSDGMVKTWMLEKDYEGVLRTALTEVEYQRLCQMYPGTRKPTRARLIASNPETVIPPRLVEVLAWLVDREADELLGGDGQEVSRGSRGEVKPK
jgi:putative ATP-dependent endonuclease of the OLD family